MKVYHGTTWHKLSPLASGRDDGRKVSGLYVTDTAERAQLYADARASGIVETSLRYANHSAIVEMDAVVKGWSRRPEDHNTLDKCEATITEWTVIKVTIYVEQYYLSHTRDKQSPYNDKGEHSRLLIERLQDEFGEKLHIVIVQ